MNGGTRIKMFEDDYFRQRVAVINLSGCMMAIKIFIWDNESEKFVSESNESEFYELKKIHSTRTDIKLFEDGKGRCWMTVIQICDSSDYSVEVNMYMWDSKDKQFIEQSGEYGQFEDELWNACCASEIWK